MIKFAAILRIGRRQYIDACKDRSKELRKTEEKTLYRLRKLFYVCGGCEERAYGNPQVGAKSRLPMEQVHMRGGCGERAYAAAVSVRLVHHATRHRGAVAHTRGGGVLGARARVGWLDESLQLQQERIHGNVMRSTLMKGERTVIHVSE